MLSKMETASSPIGLLQLTNGLVAHIAVCAAARFGIADLLADGPCDAAKVAAKLGLDESATYRTLRYLAGQGIFRQTSERQFANNDASEWLRTGVPGSVRSLMSFRGSRSFLAPLMDFQRAIQTGAAAHKGFDDLQADIQDWQLFDEAMTDLSAMSASSVVNGYDFSECGPLMDLAGGSGLLLATILRACPTLRGVLADGAEVLSRARSRPFWQGLADRVRFEPSNFFESVPAGCRTLLMKNVVHDWDDASARKILVNCRRALPSDGVLLIIEYSLGAENVPSTGKLLDIVLMASIGGRERTVDQHRELLASAGFLLKRLIPLPSDVMILEAAPSAG